ncbi:MAG: hypothetical protein PHI32_14815 [Dysgonamonadaceae bacterium]|nr:hypothetical protein [Dysgonamonadaceae bacterium]
MDFFKKLSSVYKKYNTKISLKDGIKEFEIINPNKDGSITVLLSDDELTFYFSYQHTHFHNDIDKLIEYINLFLSDSYVALEFFDGDRRLFGGGVSLQDVNIFSADEIAKRFGYNEDSFNWYIENLKSKNLSFKVRSWSGLKDVDAIIIKKESTFIVERV